MVTQRWEPVTSLVEMAAAPARATLSTWTDVARRVGLGAIVVGGGQIARELNSLAIVRQGTQWRFGGDLVEGDGRGPARVIGEDPLRRPGDARARRPVAPHRAEPSGGGHLLAKRCRRGARPETDRDRKDQE